MFFFQEILKSDPIFSVVYREAVDVRFKVHIRLDDGMFFHRRIHGGGLP